jgi:hypothetical protein
VPHKCEIVIVAKCPQCGRLPIQTRSELVVLKLAEAGELTCNCSWCDHSWAPSPPDQELIAMNLRKIVGGWPL